MNFNLFSIDLFSPSCKEPAHGGIQSSRICQLWTASHTPGQEIKCYISKYKIWTPIQTNRLCNLEKPFNNLEKYIAQKIENICLKMLKSDFEKFKQI